MRKIVLPVLMLFALALVGCGASQRPVLYPNNHLKTVGNAQADRDINECMETAATYVKKNQDSKVAEGAVKGGAIGAATGAAVGAVTGNFGRGLASGAAGGAAGGATYGAFKASEPSPVYKNFVNRCLRRRATTPWAGSERPKAAGIGNRASGRKIKIPLFPPLKKGDFFDLVA